MMYGYDMFGGMGWLGMIMMLLIWVGVIALVVWGLSGLFPRSRTAEPDALAILRRRYASGEISREEYLQAAETLQAPGVVR
ncbi:SHOCT domain-containing protein [Oscillochloris sp. ZM17-4]|uniref:SHOCT domain-containing protein n=1 Tax=Oscillochloris sp. ZM17-4 TaxID=2866714 RepID=UPI001C735CE7|nr:SHOCT domain-containing protein [Oscillochloris sp. ZM17-4]MBX0328383.1 SHOCT domain-containing protein [Oscillochloris sp. ZM17-4]